MGDTVAVAAFLELCHNARRMGRPMAVQAAGHHLMLPLVTEGACEGLVFCLPAAEKVEGHFMACAAILFCNLRLPFQPSEVYGIGCTEGPDGGRCDMWNSSGQYVCFYCP